MTQPRSARSARRTDQLDAELDDREDPSPDEPSSRAHSEVVIAASPHEVFELLADGSRYAEWVVGATEIEAEDPAFPAEGAEITPRVGVDPVSTDGTTEVTSVEEDHRLVLLAHVEPLGRARIHLELHPSTSGTRVVMEEEPVGDDLRAAAARRATWAIRARNAETLWRLKTLVESDHGPSDVFGSSTHPAAALPDVVGTATARAFAWASGVRNQRVFHPKGIAVEGEAQLTARGVGLLADRPRVRALVRVSRGIGLPHPLPDFNGIAVRLLDAHGEGHDQDLLLVSAPRGPVARHVLLPMPSFRWSGYTTILPYRTPEGLVLLAAEPLDADSTTELAASLPTELRLLVAPLLGPWEEVARVHLTEPVDQSSADALRFDPWHTSADLVPAGFLNRMRLPAYVASQAARRP